VTQSTVSKMRYDLKVLQNKGIGRILAMNSEFSIVLWEILEVHRE
jgi:hypothetical protein